MIGVVCPSSFEYKALDKKRISKRAVLILSGMGKLRAQYACGELLRRHPRLRAIALIGFAGSLSSGLKVGDVVEPRLFIEQDYNAEPLEKFPNSIRRKGPRLLKGSKDAVMLTQDKFLKENPYARSDEKGRYKTLACDMESFAVAHFCSKRNIRFAVAKIISDRADSKADHDFLNACRALSPKLNHVTLELVERLSETI